MNDNVIFCGGNFAVARLFKNDRSCHGDCTLKMNGLRGETSSAVQSVVAIAVAVSAMVCTVHGLEAETTSRPIGRPLAANGSGDLSSDWLRTAADDCKTVGWPRCVAEKVARTLRLLENAQNFPLTDGVRLVKNAAKTTDRSAKYVFSNNFLFETLSCCTEEIKETFKT